MCRALVSNLCFAKNCKALVCSVKWWRNLKCCDSGNELHAFSAAVFNQTNCMDFFCPAYTPLHFYTSKC